MLDHALIQCNILKDIRKTKARMRLRRIRKIRQKRLQFESQLIVSSNAIGV